MKAKAEWEVLKQWLISAPHLNTVEIVTNPSDPLDPEPPHELLKIAAERDLAVEWNHPNGHLPSLLAYIRAVEKWIALVYSGTSWPKTLGSTLRTTKLRAFGFNFPQTSIPALGLRHLVSLNISLGGYSLPGEDECEYQFKI